ncbi:MAG TPA: MFS transporter [Gemmatimonadaceae bacterium]|nr:MFS transporter [Gemmatimonadaceae bacterium]
MSFFTDVSSEMIYPLLPIFLTVTLGARASVVGAIEGAAESTASLLKLASGWWSDRVQRRKPLVLAGYTIASIMRPLVAIAQSAAQVLVIRVADRVGKGLRNSPRDALIADSVDPANRGRAFGFNRTGDHTGAFIGPLIAFALLEWRHVALRTVFWWAAVPGALAVAMVVFGVREVPRRESPLAQAATREPTTDSQPLGGRFWAVLGVILVFTLGNSTDAFLLLRAKQLGVPIALAPILWSFLHVVKALSSTPGGALSDRIGRKPLLVAGWLLYAVVYFAFGRASLQWQAWALFGVYGLYFGMTEGTERALVTDMVPGTRRGTAFGWYNLTIGLGALPASIVFGMLWDAYGSRMAFDFGASLALAASIGIAMIRVGR